MQARALHEAPHRPPPAPAPAAASDWQLFSHTRAALGAEIEKRAAALHAGPVGNRGSELASFRLAASARDLLDSGSTAGAVEALRVAVSLYDHNGYAYLWLACVQHLEGRDDHASEYLASARRDLPADRSIRAEVDQFARSLEAAAVR